MPLLMNYIALDFMDKLQWNEEKKILNECRQTLTNDTLSITYYMFVFNLIIIELLWDKIGISRPIKIEKKLGRRQSTKSIKMKK